MTTLDEIRTQAETDFAAAIEQLDAEHREILRDALERYGRVQDIPDSIWEQIQRNIEEQATFALLTLMIDADEWTTKEIRAQGGRSSEIDLHQQARYASVAAILSREMAATTTSTLKDRLARKVTDMRINGPGNLGNLTPGGIDKAIDEVLTDGRRKTIAIDQTTQAISAGQLGTADRAGGDGASTATGQQVAIELYWVAELDERTCDTCAPLHDQPESVWGRVFPNGPGPDAHPNCRCSLRPVVVVAVKDAENA